MSAFDTAAAKVRHTDPLLRVTKVLLYALMALAAFVAVAMAFAMPALWFVPHQVQIEDVKVTRDAFGAITLLLAMVLAMAVLAVMFLCQIVAIIDSVKLGSPFVPDNARRLRKAAWSVLAIEGLSLFTESLGHWISAKMPEAHADIDIDLSFGWLLTALLLFILARVFDQGTKLAEDVEGTV